MFQKSNLPKSLLRSLLFLPTGCLAAALSLAGISRAQAQQSVNPARVTQAVDNAVLTTLKGNRHPLARPEFDKGPVNASLPADRMQLVLKRSEGQEIALRQYLGSLQDPGSAQYRKWLTPEQFGAQYGVSDADIQTVSTWLASQGFKVNSVDKAHTIIEFSGSIGQVQTAFHTQIDNFLVNGVPHMANVADPQIPTALTPVVAGLSSLNNFFPKSQTRQRQVGKYDKATGKMSPELTVGSGTTSDPYALYVVAGDAATIYDTPNSFNANFLATGTSYTGSGVTIGILGDSNIALSDVADYRSNFGLSATPPTVIIDGTDPGVNGDVVEALLDLEVSGGLAPDAALNFYIGANTNLNGGVFLALTRAVNDNAASILNLSFGYCEAFSGSSQNQFFYNSWEQAAAQGITVTVSSGDNGSAGCDDFNTAMAAQYGLNVSGFASTPFNIAVGGTDFDALSTDFTKYVAATNSANYTSALGYIPEVPGNGSTAVNGLLSANTPSKDSNGDTNIFAASGGASSCVLPQYDANGNLTGCGPVTGTLTGWPKPSWQTGSSLNIPSDGVRDLPDVALFGAFGPNPAAWLVCYTTTTSSGTVSCAKDAAGNFSFYGVGGTSAASPAFAGIMALVAQSQGGSKGPARLGQANYVLYNLAAQNALYGTVFHDTTSGNNSVYCVQGSPDCGANLFETGYNAGVGYDQASGLGSVDATQLISNWTKATFTPTTSAFTINGGTAAISITHGQSVTLDASVTGSAAPVPTGSVAIVSNANEQAGTYNSDGLGSFPLTNGTTGSVAYSNLPGGTYSVYANYGGDIDNAQSQSNSIQVTVAKEDSVTNLFGANGEQNFTPTGSYPYGTYFSLDAQPVGVSQVSSATPAAATGSIVFADTAGAFPGGVSGTVPIASGGIAELPVNYLSTAAHSVSASYAGDNSLNASTATPLAFTITLAPTASTVTSSSASVSGGTFTLTSVITPNPASGASNPTGTVVFIIPGSTLGTGSVSALQDPNTGASLGTAAITISASLLASGANTITATYSGDTNYAASSGTVSVTYTPVTASFTLTSTAATVSSPGQSGSSTITITPTSYTGTVNLTCALATSPTGADTTYNPACTVPASASVTSAAPVTATASFTTTAPTSGALAYPQTNRWYIAGGAALACILFFGIPARRRGWRSMLGLLIFLVTMAGVGCGGGGGGGGNNGTPGTTVGTYTFTVTGTDSVTATVTSKTTVTLTVN